MAKKRNFNDRHMQLPQAALRSISVSSARGCRSHSGYSTFQLKASSDDLFKCLVVKFVGKKSRNFTLLSQTAAFGMAFYFTNKNAFQ